MSLAQKKMVSMGFMVAALIAAIVIKEGTLGKLWFVLIMIGLVLNVVWLRCPHCGMFLGKYSGVRCNACGKEIDWHDKNAKFTRHNKETLEEIFAKAEEEIGEEEIAEAAGETVEETVGE